MRVQAAVICLPLRCHGIAVQSCCHARSGGHDMVKPLDSGFRRAATGVLGGLFPTPLYRLRPVGVPSRRIQDFLSINDDE